MRSRQDWSEIVCRDYKHLKAEEHEALVDHILSTHPDHRQRPDEEMATPPVTQHPAFTPSDSAWLKRIFWAIVALMLVTLLAPHLHAQGKDSQIFVIKIQSNNGTSVGSIAAPFTFKAGANCTWSKSVSTYTFNCSGGAASAGGSNTQVQWNSTGSLAGIATLTTDGTIVTQKVGTNLLFADPTDATKKIQFDASGVSAATTRTVTFPDANSRTIKNGTTTGQIPIWNAGTSTFDVSDPLVQGTTAEGAAIPNPVVIGGKDGSGNNKAIVLDASGRPTVNVNGTVAVSAASLPLPTGAAADSSLTTIDTDLKANVTLHAGTNVIGHVISDTGSTTAVTGTVTVSGTVTTTPPSNASTNIAQVGGTAVVADPCQANAKVYLPISLTASTQIVAGTSAKKIYICAMDLISAAADNIALVEGTGSVCATGIAGMAGGTTAATGWNFAANGGMTLGNGSGAVIAEATNADNMCLLVSGATQVSGSIAYVVQ